MKLYLFRKYSELLDAANDIDKFDFKHFNLSTKQGVLEDSGVTIQLGVVGCAEDIERFKGRHFESIQPSSFLKDYPELWSLVRKAKEE